jgi:hypothetical protein
MARLGPLPNVANVCKVRLIGQFYGHTWVNVMYARFTGGTINQAALDTFSSAIRIAWVANMAARYITNSGLTSVEVTDLTTRTGLQSVDSVGGTGSDATAGAPASAAICVSLVNGKRYRGGHPRQYLSGVNASAYTNGSTISNTVANNYKNSYTAFINAINALTTGGATWDVVSVGFYQSAAGVQSYRIPPEVLKITAVKVHTRLDTQRRRLGKETG